MLIKEASLRVLIRRNALLAAELGLEVAKLPEEARQGLIFYLRWLEIELM